MDLYFILTAWGATIISMIAAAMNIRLSVVHTGSRRILDAIGVVSYLYVAGFYFLDLIGVFDPGLQGAVIMRPILIFIIAREIYHMILEWPRKM